MEKKHTFDRANSTAPQSTQERSLRDPDLFIVWLIYWLRPVD